jgi:hypothetical protein
MYLNTEISINNSVLPNQMIFVPPLDAYKNTSSGRIRYLIDQITELSPISAEQVSSLSWSIPLNPYHSLSLSFSSLHLELSHRLLHHIKYFLSYFLSRQETNLQTARLILKIVSVENPPLRINVRQDSVDQVKDKLKTLSEELEEFEGASVSVDVNPAVSTGERDGTS